MGSDVLLSLRLSSLKTLSPTSAKVPSAVVTAAAAGTLLGAEASNASVFS
jgi:hypothetical protein